MLAALGWVTSETLHTPLANLLGAESLLQEGADSVAEKVPKEKNKKVIIICLAPEASCKRVQAL